MTIERASTALWCYNDGLEVALGPPEGFSPLGWQYFFTARVIESRTLFHYGEFKKSNLFFDALIFSSPQKNEAVKILAEPESKRLYRQVIVFLFGICLMKNLMLSEFEIR